MSIMGIRLDELTVILPTRNEAHNIRNFLKSLPEINLIVIDASEDPTPDIVYSLRPDYTEVIRHPGTITEARRIGADTAKTPWLLFTDADIVFSAEYFRNISEVEEYDLIYGPKLLSDRYRAYYKWFSNGQRLLHILGIAAVSGSNCIIKKEAYDAAVGFDPELNCYEDSELAWRIKHIGYRPFFTLDLVVYAGDHRRLEKGIMKKTLHSITRCAALYLNLLSDEWKSREWGYWSQYNSTR